MRRREFITLLGGAAVAWPGETCGQQGGLRRVGVLTLLSAKTWTARLLLLLMVCTVTVLSKKKI